RAPQPLAMAERRWRGINALGLVPPSRRGLPTGHRTPDGMTPRRGIGHELDEIAVGIAGVDAGSETPAAIGAAGLVERSVGDGRPGLLDQLDGLLDRPFEDEAEVAAAGQRGGAAGVEIGILPERGTVEVELRVLADRDREDRIPPAAELLLVDRP